MAQRQSYGKAIVFDYSYRYFYGDGYGKEYNILNLPAGYDPTVRRRAAHGQPAGILRADAALRRRGAVLRPYQIEPPLLVFVGHTVQTGKTESQLNAEDKASLSDVLNMVRFLARVVRDEDGWAVKTVQAILDRRSDLRDEAGRDIFADKLKTLPRGPGVGQEIYADMLGRLFHAPAAPHCTWPTCGMRRVSLACARATARPTSA